ncbi:hypothetical protein C0J52_01586 [Blattella germanica]|nr:hypothetical protein C0J52_01586 [Blattella germanica]
MLILEGIPLFLIELGIGQKMRLSSLGVWNTIHPWLGGIGIASCVVTFFVALYYNVIITWCFYYLFNSLQVVYFTSMFPYLVLTIFFVKGLTLKGSGAGIIHMYTPKVSKLSFDISTGFLRGLPPNHKLSPTWIFQGSIYEMFIINSLPLYLIYKVYFVNE